ALCEVAVKNSYFSVCVNPCNISFCKEYLKTLGNHSVKIATVVGFPLGANATATKVFETKQAILDGADEIDVVLNIGRAKDGDFEYVKNELKEVKQAAGEHVVKVILETCYFEMADVEKLVQVCVDARVDFVKTSTGFGTAGANNEVVNLMFKTANGKCKVKASGGIKTREQAIELIKNGASRIGTSSEI
ncbi:MAG: deoxyribose-phosphate aldolase, partial [Clostridia bacterium]|nr:deoxyribose-phosphate aldolase [Clostridia bacterium]